MSVFLLSLIKDEFIIKYDGLSIGLNHHFLITLLIHLLYEMKDQVYG